MEIEHVEYVYFYFTFFFLTLPTCFYLSTFLNAVVVLFKEYVTL